MGLKPDTSSTLNVCIKEAFEYMNTHADYCCYCGIYLTVATKTTEHLIPKSKGGTGAKWNKMPCCKSCNGWRGNKDYDVWKPEILLAAKSLNIRTRRNIRDVQIMIDNIEHIQEYLKFKTI